MFYWGLSSKGQHGPIWLKAERLAQYRAKMMQSILRWQAKNPDKVRACNIATKKKHAANGKESLRRWKCTNKARWRALKAAWHKKQMKESPAYRLKITLRARLHVVLKSRGFKKRCAMNAVLGCNAEFLKGYIEAQFLPGMSWDRRTEFHVDHRIPLSSAKTEAEMIALCHYTNLRPMWAIENLLKGSKIPNQTSA